MEQGNPSLWKDIQVHKRWNQMELRLGETSGNLHPTLCPSRVTQGWLHRTLPRWFWVSQRTPAPPWAAHASTPLSV